MVESFSRLNKDIPSTGTVTLRTLLLFKLGFEGLDVGIVMAGFTGFLLQLRPEILSILFGGEFFMTVKALHFPVLSINLPAGIKIVIEIDILFPTG